MKIEGSCSRPEQVTRHIRELLCLVIDGNSQLKQPQGKPCTVISYTDSATLKVQITSADEDLGPSEVQLKASINWSVSRGGRC